MIRTKSFYILLICAAVLLGLVVPLWFLYGAGLSVALACDRWGIPGMTGIIFFAATSGPAVIATLLFTYACSHLEVKGGTSEH